MANEDVQKRKRNRGNSNWGTAIPVLPEAATEFEKQMHQMGLTKETCAEPAKLREWCQQNKDRCYISEWLLKVWDISPNPTL